MGKALSNYRQSTISLYSISNPDIVSLHDIVYTQFLRLFLKFKHIDCIPLSSAVLS